MNNKEIIREIAIREGIITEQEASRMDEWGNDIPLHTASGWKQKGYRVKEGETGIEARLWKKAEMENRFYKSKAYLFSITQVEVLP